MTSGFISRRGFVGATLAGAAALSLPAQRSSAQGARLKELKIGYQKNGILVIARQQATFENHFKKDGIDVKWVEFTAGPPMMEAMNAGSIDFGAVGDSPPIFAQAAGANIVYAAGQPITNGQGILVQQNSPIKTLADLKGKRIAFTRGSSANNVVLVALEKAGLVIQRHHAGLSRSAGSRPGFRQRHDRCLGDLGSVLRHCRGQAERAHSHQRA